MNCPNCGSQNAEGVTFCANCGTRLKPAQPMPANPHLTIQLPSLEPRDEPRQEPRDTPQTPPYGNPTPPQTPSYGAPVPSQQTMYGGLSEASGEGGARTYDTPSNPEPTARTYDMPVTPSPLPPGGMGVPASNVGPQAPASRGSGIAKWLLFGCLGALVLLLLFCGIVAIFARDQLTALGEGFSLSTASGLSNLATARNITEDRAPVDPTSTFGTDEKIFITYEVGGAEAGQAVQFEYFFNDQSMGSTSQEFNASGDFTGYFSIEPPNDPGSYRADLTYNGATQSVSWTVE